MVYPENIVIKELMWEYDYTEKQAESIVHRYKQNNSYIRLCELIQCRLSLRNQKENLSYV